MNEDINDSLRNVISEIYDDNLAAIKNGVYGESYE